MKESLLNQLLAEARAFCKQQRGRVTILADFLEVAQPQLSAWLAGKMEPGGEVTLKIQAWIAQEKAAETTRQLQASEQLRAAMDRKTKAAQGNKKENHDSE